MLVLLFIASFIVRAIMVLAPRVLMWDGAIYVGMGKYIFSHGTLGYWEPFRPVIWPLILGIFWKLHLDAYSIGVCIQVFSGLAAVYFTYKIGEKVKRGSGIYAAAILSFTPIFLAFTIAPLTDISSAALALVGLYFFLEEYFFTAGILVGCAFLFRFPEVLIAVPLGIMALVYLVRGRRTRPIGRFLLGILPILLAFFIFNIAIYHDPLLPIRTANAVTSASVGPHDHDPFFYTLYTLAENPFIIFAAIALFVWLRKYASTLRHPARILVMLSALIIASYFNFFPHKELRYSIAFLPYLSIMAGFGIYLAFKNIKSGFVQPIILTAITASLLFISVNLLKNNTPQTPPPAVQEYLDFFHTLQGVSVISSSPEIMVNNDIRATSINDMWEDIDTNYRNPAIPKEYAAINTCALSCLTTQAKCDATREDIMSSLETKTLVYSSSVNSCRFLIYKINQ